MTGEWRNRGHGHCGDPLPASDGTHPFDRGGFHGDRLHVDGHGRGEFLAHGRNERGEPGSLSQYRRVGVDNPPPRRSQPVGDLAQQDETVGILPARV